MLQTSERPSLSSSKNGDGTIATKELGAVMLHLGQDPTEAGVAGMVNDLAGDGNGTIGFLDFLTLVAGQNDPPTAELIDTVPVPAECRHEKMNLGEHLTDENATDLGTYDGKAKVVHRCSLDHVLDHLTDPDAADFRRASLLSTKTVMAPS